MKHFATKFFTILLAVVLLMSFVGCSSCNDSEEPAQKERLKSPLNYIFNSNNNCFEWTPVENADAYLVEYEGKTQTVTTPSFQVTPKGEVTEIHVQAIDTTGKYEPSRSISYTYTLPPA